MKINIFILIHHHLSTLKNEGTKDTSIADVIVFFLLPVAAAVGATVYRFSPDREIYNITVAAFAIFAALLLSVQVALFSILQRPPQRDDTKTKTRVSMLRDLNINISYMTLMSCLCVAFSLFFHSLNFRAICLFSYTETALFVFLVTHSILTLMMVVKRTFVVFHKEYDDTLLEE